ncbi:SGNH/GDSL hydrolase family protein [Thiobacillus sp.]|uniref:SGNH/GDSL hydrolase family protein n=1 Tax=Thiobacillus sp. TaxID=924 RepID=UPI0017E36353|nr:SGNH/GDSL hydrolase family protein [Thiobacillus sp.]MBC2731377.1 SGNH/GDSL hydrolase family protein [Thiobacillus sp.]MBC2740114.1 SGNH/GDSL hydrolase family protein [Thiobacillus sp.]MBC2758326.1 SGNH/GDSL hydrolase family protein [Thiobacillus sp.]
MTIKLTASIFINGNDQPIGTQLTLEADREAELVNRGVAVFVSLNSTNGLKESVMVDKRGRLQSDTHGILPHARNYGLRTVLFGHSYVDNEDVSGTFITNGTAVLGGFHWANALMERRFNIIKGAGVGGERIVDIMQRYDVNVAAYSPDIIFLTIGHNDLNDVVNTLGAGQVDTGIPYVDNVHCVELPYFMSKMNELLDMIPTSTLVVITGETQPGPNPAGTKNASTHKQLGQRFANMNRELARLALTRKNVVYVPTDLIHINPADTDLCTAIGEYTDQVHPSVVGSYKRGKMIKAYIEPHIPKLYAPLAYSVGEVLLNQRLPFTAISGDGETITITMNNSAPGNHADKGRIKVGDTLTVQCPNDPTWSFTSDPVTEATLTYIKVPGTTTGTTNSGYVSNCPQMCENPVFTAQTGGSKHANITLSSGALPGSWTLNTTAGAGVVSVAVTYEPHMSADGLVSLGYWVVLDLTTTGAADVILQQGVSDQSTGSYHRRLNAGDNFYSGCEVDISGTISNFNGFELRNYIDLNPASDVYTADFYRGSETSPWPQDPMRLTLMTPDYEIPSGFIGVTPQLYMRFSGAGSATIKIARFSCYRNDEPFNAAKFAVQ